MRVIFLDIDGVLQNNIQIFLNGFRCKYMGNFDRNSFDATAVSVIRYCARLLDARIVLCSTWGYNCTPQELMKLGAVLGISFYGCVDDDLIGSRVNFISKWLEDHPEVTEYAIIDDESDQYTDTPHHTQVIAVNESETFDMSRIELLAQVFKVDLMQLSQSRGRSS